MKKFNKKCFAMVCLYTVFLALQIATLCLCLVDKTYGETETAGQFEVYATETVEMEKVNEWENCRAEALKMVKEEDIIELAKLTYGEAGGIPSLMEKAAVMWCACNRADVNECSIAKMASNRGVFYGYHRSNPVTDELRSLAEDVLTRYYMEKLGVENVGRVLPRHYLYFHGDGKHNYFREKFKSKVYYSWNEQNPYNS